MQRFSWMIVLAALAIPIAAAGATAVVDEPVGAHYSLGLTLWHLAHQADRIRQFHAYLKQQGVNPESLLPAGTTPPKTMNRILLEPELLTPKQLGGAAGWTPEGDYLTSGLGDGGPTASMPLRIDKAGTYRLWVRYYGYTTGTGVTFLKIARNGSDDAGPLVDDEIYDRAVAKEGPTWKDILVDLEAGDYTLQIGHVARLWQALSPPNGYAYRKIDCFYLTDELWADPPSDRQRKQMRAAAKPNGIQWTAAPALAAADQDAWRLWQARPLSWEDAAKNPKLFRAGRAFWKTLVDDLGRLDYSADKAPDYRTPQRQVVFDDVWNMVGNPVRIRKQVAALKSDIREEPASFRHYWLPFPEFQEISPEWGPAAGMLVAGYGDMGGTAKTTLRVDRPGKYYCWVRRCLMNGFYAPWSVSVTDPKGKSVKFDNDQKEYPSEWSRVGVLEMAAPGELRICLSPLLYRVPGTYRRIGDFFITTDPNYEPKGTVHPPITREQYLEKAASLGAKTEFPCLLWSTTDIHSALLQEAWPKTPVPQASPSEISLKMAADSFRSAQLYLRSTEAAPTALTVACGPLCGKGGAAADKVSWRVIGFVPYAPEFRQNWSPFCLLRRPFITVPPYNVAGIWLTVDSRGLPAGDYTSDVVLRSKGTAPRTVTLKVSVSPVKIAPRQPVLVGGWTYPPDVENALRDYSEHGMKIWCAEVSKAEMRKRGYRLLALAHASANEQEIRDRVERLKKLGLDYSDYIFDILDEPGGKTAAELKPFLDIAKAIRKVDPNVRISFNPGEAAGLETFQTLDPYCDFWIPYADHVYYAPPLVAMKQAIYAKKPWLWYTTPCLWDKSPGMAAGIFDQIRAAPGQAGNCLGTEFFAFYYPFRDAWDAGYEYIPDVSVMVLPSRHGVVPTPTYEAIREGIQTADLAYMVKERAGAKINDPVLKKLIDKGAVEELLAWLEANPN